LYRNDLNQQRLMLQLIEKATLGITARRLPPRDHGASFLVELAVHLGFEAKTVQPPLHVAALALIEADLVFGRLVGFFGEGGGVDTPVRLRVVVEGPFSSAAILARANDLN
jgi:hypothetical protein